MKGTSGEAALGRLLLAFIEHGRASVACDVWLDVENELCEFLGDRAVLLGCDERAAALALLAYLTESPLASGECH